MILFLYNYCFANNQQLSNMVAAYDNDNHVNSRVCSVSPKSIYKQHNLTCSDHLYLFVINTNKYDGIWVQISFMGPKNVVVTGNEKM